MFRTLDGRVSLKRLKCMSFNFIHEFKAFWKKKYHVSIETGSNIANEKHWLTYLMLIELLKWI